MTSINWRIVLRAVCIVFYSVVILAGFAYLFFFSIESYFYPYPSIDTQLTDDFSWEGWYAITHGMTKQEVSALIGHPLAGDAYLSESIDSCYGYSDDDAFQWWDFAWFDLYICYSATGFVVEKGKTIMYD